MTELDSVVVSTPTVEGEIFLQGAHVARWSPAGQKPVLFLSSRSAFSRGKAIRGGIPIIFPWFGSPPEGKPGPQHGFARTSLWTLEYRGAEELTLGLRAAGFRLRFEVTFGTTLAMSLEVLNESDATLRFEEALHTYLAVGDVREVSVTGLSGAAYLDKTDGFRRKVQGGEALRITKETDSVFLNTTANCVVHDPVWNRRLEIEKTGSSSTVVWNPWVEKAAALADMAPAEWQCMICVETANAAENAVLLPPGATHRMKATIRLL